MEFLILTAVAIAIVMLIMAVGVILKRPCLRGSCGGPTIFDSDGDPVTCGACPRRKEFEEQAASRPAPIVSEHDADGFEQETETVGAGASRRS